MTSHHQLLMTITMTEQSTGSFSIISVQNEINEMKKSFFMSVILLMITGHWDSRPKQLDSAFGSKNRTHLIRRKRRDVEFLFSELGDNNTRRAYRMKKFVFWKLCDLLREKLEPQYDDPFSVFRIPNGLITHTVRVSIALRYLAGGQPLDIALVHGVSHSEVFESLWKVVDAINQHPELAITFPTSHQQQLALADDFRKKSSAGFSNCMGAIDGILKFSNFLPDKINISWGLDGIIHQPILSFRIIPIVCFWK
jgi:hypothetical protein